MNSHYISANAIGYSNKALQLRAYGLSEFRKTIIIKKPGIKPGFLYQKRINALSTVDVYVLYADPLSSVQLYVHHALQSLLYAAPDAVTRQTPSVHG